MLAFSIIPSRTDSANATIKCQYIERSGLYHSQCAGSSSLHLMCQLEPNIMQLRRLESECNEILQCGWALTENNWFWVAVAGRSLHGGAHLSRQQQDRWGSAMGRERQSQHLLLPLRPLLAIQVSSVNRFGIPYSYNASVNLEVRLYNACMNAEASFKRRRNLNEVA